MAEYFEAYKTQCNLEAGSFKVDLLFLAKAYEIENKAYGSPE